MPYVPEPGMITADLALYTSHNIESMSSITRLNGSDLRARGEAESDRAGADGAGWAAGTAGSEMHAGRIGTRRRLHGAG
jgi:hypothetical protein